MHPTPQSPVKAKLIGQILVESKAITSDQLEKALNRQAEEGGLICTLVVRLGMAQPAQVFGALAQQLGVPYADLKHETISKAFGVEAARPSKKSRRNSPYTTN